MFLWSSSGDLGYHIASVLPEDEHRSMLGMINWPEDRVIRCQNARDVVQLEGECPLAAVAWHCTAHNVDTTIATISGLSVSSASLRHFIRFEPGAFSWSDIAALSAGRAVSLVQVMLRQRGAGVR